jgi:CTP synthase (UTP-ammonia lyase)
VEIARNVLRVEHADHAEEHPDAADLVITPLTCSLVGQRHPVYLTPGSRAARLYGGGETEEPYYCNYGLNAEFEPRLEAAGLHITGRDADGAARIAELDGHPFFVITLYVFQARDRSTGSHPITRAFLEAATAHTQASRR